jgi:hypothetical protein
VGLKVRVAVLAGVIAGLAASFAWAGRFNEAEVGLTLGEKSTAVATSMKLSIKYSNRGQKKGPSQLAITLPKGSTIDTGAPGQCSSSASDPTECPPNARIGTGKVLLFEDVEYDVTVTNQEDETLRIWVEIAKDSYFPLTATISGRTIEVGILAFSKLNLNVEKVTGGNAAFIRTPGTCPSSGKWTSVVKTTYSGEDFKDPDDDIVETDRPKTPCNG